MHVVYVLCTSCFLLIYNSPHKKSLFFSIRCEKFQKTCQLQESKQQKWVSSLLDPKQSQQCTKTLPTCHHGICTNDNIIIKVPNDHLHFSFFGFRMHKNTNILCPTLRSFFKRIFVISFSRFPSFPFFQLPFRWHLSNKKAPNLFNSDVFSILFIGEGPIPIEKSPVF